MNDERREWGLDISKRLACGVALVALLFNGQRSRADGDRFVAQPLVVSVAAASQAATGGQSVPDSRPAVRRRARLMKLNAIPTLEVDGAPFLLLGAQCDIWRSTRQDERTLAFFDGYQAMNSTAVSIGVPWSKLEPSEGIYDFRFLDWFIEQARRRGLKLVVNLFSPGFARQVSIGRDFRRLSFVSH